jgi:hypothetical protein
MFQEKENKNINIDGVALVPEEEKLLKRRMD